MKVKVLAFLLLSFFSTVAQEKKETYFLLESGYENVNGSPKIHFGSGVERFISRRGSITLRMKYLHIGIDVREKGSPGILFGKPSYRFLYKGSIISIPFNYKFENKLIKDKAYYFFNVGLALNFILEEQYLIADNIAPYTGNQTYMNFNLGIGFIIKASQKIDILISGETFLFGGGKTEPKGTLVSNRLRPDQSIINTGIRFKI